MIPDAVALKLIEEWRARVGDPLTAAMSPEGVFRYCADALQAALDATGTEEEAEDDAGAMARWIVREAADRETDSAPFPVVFDHSCAECIPGGSLVTAGFRCAVHVARSIIAASPRPAPAPSREPLKMHRGCRGDEECCTSSGCDNATPPTPPTTEKP